MSKSGQRLAGKSALITAAGQGIGRATAEMFAAEGARVLAADINAAALAEVGKTSGIKTIALDLTKADAIGELVEKAGAVDILFNCAGFVHSGTILRLLGKGLGFLVRIERADHVPAHSRPAARHA